MEDKDIERLASNYARLRELSAHLRGLDIWNIAEDPGRAMMSSRDMVTEIERCYQIVPQEEMQGRFPELYATVVDAKELADGVFRRAQVSFGVRIEKIDRFKLANDSTKEIIKHSYIEKEKFVKDRYTR